LTARELPWTNSSVSSTRFCISDFGGRGES
jgi:hypothetical protein